MKKLFNLQTIIIFLFLVWAISFFPMYSSINSYQLYTLPFKFGPRAMELLIFNIISLLLLIILVTIYKARQSSYKKLFRDYSWIVFKCLFLFIEIGTVAFITSVLFIVEFGNTLWNVLFAINGFLFFIIVSITEAEISKKYPLP